MIVVPGFYFTYSCPHCQHVMEVRLFGVYSALGSSLMVCDNCGTISEIDRNEWADFPLFHRVMFGITTLVYAAWVGFFGGAFSLSWWYLVIIGEDKKISFEAFFGDPVFVVAAVGLMLMVVGIQVQRIRRSLKRTIVDEGVPVRNSFFNLETNLQSKFGLLFVASLLFVLVSWGIRAALIYFFFRS